MHIPPPVITLCFVAVLYGIKTYLPAWTIAAPGLKPLAFLIAMIAIIIMTVATYQFRRARTTILPHKSDETSHLVTSGIFSYSRNPMYLGMVMIILAAGLQWGVWLAPLTMIAFVLVINKIQIIQEEKSLSKLFGSDFEAYKTKTRRWI